MSTTVRSALILGSIAGLLCGARVAPAAVPAAQYFVEATSALPSGSVGTPDPNTPGAATLDVAYSDGRSFRAEAQASAGSMTSPPKADVQAHGVGVMSGSANAEVQYWVGVTPRPGAPTVSVRLRIRALANAVASVEDDFSRVQSFARIRLGQGALIDLASVDCVVGADCTTENVTNAVFQPHLLPGQSMRIFKQATVAMYGAYSFMRATGYGQAVVDPHIEIDPEHRVLVNGEWVLATDLYDLEISEGIGNGECPADDSDCDGFPDGDDVCPFLSSLDQTDTDGNRIGDLCECGDQNGDGAVNIDDLLEINDVLFGAAHASSLCDANGDGLCDVGDILAVNGKIFGLPTHCAEYPAP